MQICRHVCVCVCVWWCFISSEDSWVAGLSSQGLLLSQPSPSFTQTQQEVLRPRATWVEPSYSWLVFRGSRKALSSFIMMMVVMVVMEDVCD